MKRLVSVIIMAMTIVLFFGCGSKAISNDNDSTTKEAQLPEVVRIGALSGPTGYSMAKLRQDAADNKTKLNYSFADFSTDPAAFVAPLTAGDMDVAAVPANLAASIYNKTDGRIKVIAICTQGVVNLVERGSTITNYSDLKGKTIYATGQGAVPEYVIRYILKSNGIDPDKDITLTWCADTTEALSYITKAEGAVAFLPQPFVTAAMSKVSDLRIVYDLNEEWNKLNNGSMYITGVVVARTEFIENNKEAIDIILNDLKESTSFTNNNTDEAARLIVNYGIVQAEPVARQSISGCHLVSISGNECKSRLSAFLKILYEENPKAVGGKLPDEDFYLE